MSKKILIVDDSITARKLIMDCLQGGSWTVIEAGDGKDGLAKLDQNPDIKLIFSDINMPWMSGLEMIEEIKSRSEFKAIPICMLTTESGAESIEAAKRLGVDAFLVKPVEREQVLAVVEAYLNAS